MNKKRFLLFCLIFAVARLFAASKTEDDTLASPGKVFRLNGISFELGKASLRDNNKDALQSLVTFLSSKPGIVFEIGCHTGPRGADTFNLRLSEERAKTVYDTLIGLGVRRSRLVWKGYGETEPLAVPGKKPVHNPGEGDNHRLQLKVIRVEKTFSDSVFRPGEIVRIPAIIFAFDDRRQISLRDSLKKTELFIKAHPELVLEIGCHTDARGSDKNNEKLAAARAKYLYDILLASGVYAPRLLYKGYGESKLIVNDQMIRAEKDKMKIEELHQVNRRTELKVLAVNGRSGQ